MEEEKQEEIEEEKKPTKKEELEEKEKLIEKEEDLQRREEEIAARNQLGGTSDAGEVPVKAEPLSDTQYAEALERGEVNPLKEDGLI